MFLERFDKMYKGHFESNLVQTNYYWREKVVTRLTPYEQTNIEN